MFKVSLDNLGRPHPLPSFHFRMDWGRRGPVHKGQGGTARSVGIQPGTQSQQVVWVLADCLSKGPYLLSLPGSGPQHCTDCTIGDHVQVQRRHRQGATETLLRATVDQERSQPQSISMFPEVVCHLGHPSHSAATVTPIQLTRMCALQVPALPEWGKGAGWGDEEGERPVPSKGTGSCPRQQASP